MKKTVAFSLFLSLSMLSFAQTEKGTVLFGANGGGGIGSSSGNNSIYLEIQPKLGFFVANKLAVGSRLGYSINSGGAFGFSKYTIAPFARYYTPIYKGFALFGQPEVALNFARYRNTEINPVQLEEWSMNFGAGLGLSYFFTKNISMEIQGNYYKRIVLNKNNAIGAIPHSGIDLRIGVSAYINRKKD